QGSEARSDQVQITSRDVTGHQHAGHDLRRWKAFLGEPPEERLGYELSCSADRDSARGSFHNQPLRVAGGGTVLLLSRDPEHKRPERRAAALAILRYVHADSHLEPNCHSLPRVFYLSTQSGAGQTGASIEAARSAARRSSIRVAHCQRCFGASKRRPFATGHL